MFFFFLMNLRPPRSTRTYTLFPSPALGRSPCPLETPVGELPIGARQMVSITQALASGAEIGVMDEPTASPAGHERERVYETIRRLAAEGKAVLFVSHFIDEIMALTDDEIGRASCR